MKTQAKTTDQLNTGDVILHYGATLKLTERRESDDGVVQFDSECLGLSDDATMPRHWVARPGGYRVQGNQLAAWEVLVNGE